MLGHTLHGGLDPDGTGLFTELAESPLIVDIVADPTPASYLILGPSRVAAGEPAPLQIVALDAGGNLATGAASELTLTAPASNSSRPPTPPSNG
jgi:hypothetical protein